MRIARLLRSSTFRLAVLYMALFGGIGGGAAGFHLLVDRRIHGVADRRHYRGRGYRARGALWHLRPRWIEFAPSTSGFPASPMATPSYLLTDDQLTPLIGNLDRWPRVTKDSDGCLNFNLEQETVAGEVTHRARARPFTLRGGVPSAGRPRHARARRHTYSDREGLSPGDWPLP